MTNIDRLIVSESARSERSEFYKKTYLHVALAVLAFMVIESVLIKYTPSTLIDIMFGGSYVWLFIIGAFWLGSFIAQKFAFSASRSTQYLGLFLYVILEAIIFLPLLYIASAVAESSIILPAALVTLFLFAGLSAVAFLSGKDFSFLRSAIIIGGFIALGLIVVGVIFGFNLGFWFTAGMIILASASILYQTSQIQHHHTTDQYVGAALQLFASIMLLFWYILRFFSDRD